MEVLRIRPYLILSLLLGWGEGEIVRHGVVTYLFVGKVEECAVVDAAVVEDVLV